MAWVVDTCILIDVLEDDPNFGEVSASTLDSCADDGLVICPMTYVELAPAFDGSRSLQDEFLDGVGVSRHEEWIQVDTLATHAAWHEHIMRRRAGRTTKRPTADLMIGGFARRFQGLITRNPADFRNSFPELDLVIPRKGSSGVG